MKVWMVTSGDYSDYCVEHIFSTEDGAKDFVAKRTRKDGYCWYRVEGPLEVDEKIADPTWVGEAHSEEIVSGVWSDPRCSCHLNHCKGPLADIVSVKHGVSYAEKKYCRWTTWGHTEEEAVAKVLQLAKVNPWTDSKNAVAR